MQAPLCARSPPCRDDQRKCLGNLICQLAQICEGWLMDSLQVAQASYMSGCHMWHLDTYDATARKLYRENFYSGSERHDEWEKCTGPCANLHEAWYATRSDCLRVRSPRVAEHLNAKPAPEASRTAEALLHGTRAQWWGAGSTL